MRPRCNFMRSSGRLGRLRKFPPIINQQVDDAAETYATPAESMVTISRMLGGNRVPDQYPLKSAIGRARYLLHERE